MTFVRDCIAWAFCWACYRFYLLAPIRWRLSLWALPFAGMYAFSSTWADFRNCVEWKAAGKPLDFDWGKRP